MKSVNASVKTIQYDTAHLKCIQNLTDTQLYLTHLSMKKNTKRKELNTTFYFVLRSVVVTLLCIESILRVHVHLSERRITTSVLYRKTRGTFCWTFVW